MKIRKKPGVEKLSQILHLSLKSSSPDLEEGFSSYSSVCQKESKFSLRDNLMLSTISIYFHIQEESFFQELPSNALLPIRNLQQICKILALFLLKKMKGSHHNLFVLDFLLYGIGN